MTSANEVSIPTALAVAITRWAGDADEINGTAQVRFSRAHALATCGRRMAIVPLAIDPSIEFGVSVHALRGAVRAQQVIAFESDYEWPRETVNVPCGHLVIRSLEDGTVEISGLGAPGRLRSDPTAGSFHPWNKIDALLEPSAVSAPLRIDPNMLEGAGAILAGLSLPTGIVLTSAAEAVGPFVFTAISPSTHLPDGDERRVRFVIMGLRIGSVTP